MKDHRQTHYILLCLNSSDHILGFQEITQYHIYVHLASEQEPLILMPTALD